MAEYEHPVRTSRIYDIPGYVLDEYALACIHKTAREVVITDSGKSSDDVTLACWCGHIPEGNASMPFTSKSDRMYHTIERLIIQLDATPKQPQFVSLSYQLDRTGVSINFHSNGKIEFSGFSNNFNFEFYVNRLDNEIKRCDQEYPWIVKRLIFSPQPLKILVALFLGIFLVLLLNISHYFYIRNEYGNIDESFVQDNDAYFQEIETALTDDSMSKKLDALLLAQLREFRNTQSTIQNGEIRNLLLSIVFLITIILAGMLKGISRLYPVSFFALGHRWKEAWKKNKESRKFWVVTVILGLVINILGGGNSRNF